MSLNFTSIKPFFQGFWKELFGSPLNDRKFVKINTQEAAELKKEEVESILKEHKLDKVKVEFVFDPKKGAEFTLKGEIPITSENMQAYRHAMDKIGNIGLKFFFCQQTKGGKLILDSLYPYGFGK